MRLAHEDVHRVTAAPARFFVARPTATQNISASCYPRHSMPGILTKLGSFGCKCKQIHQYMKHHLGIIPKPQLFGRFPAREFTEVHEICPENMAYTARKPLKESCLVNDKILKFTAALKISFV